MNSTPGLSAAEAEKRQIEFGPNEVIPSQLKSRFAEIRKILSDPMGLMLLILSAIYALIGDRTDAIILFVAYVPVTAIDVILELKAQKALSALKSTFKFTCKIMRDGVAKEVPLRNVVPGDVIIFEEGQALPADGRVLESHDLSINEAALTGESVPVEKSTEQPFFGGTIVLQGRGLGVIDKIGKETRFGKIASLLQQTQSDESPLQQKVNAIIKKVIVIAVGLAILLFGIEYFRSRQFLQSIIVALTFGMAAVPEEFPLVFTLYLSLGAWRLSKYGVLVKSLPSVETLGSVNIICTDKTGTLTLGQFQLEELISIEPSISVETQWQIALLACEIIPVDSMETAIFERGQNYINSIKQWKLIWDYPFERLGKHMSHVWTNSTGAQQWIVIKGAVEGVLEHCKITDVKRVELMNQVSLLASQGKRLLGLAYRDCQSTGSRQLDEKNLNFIGLLVFNDPVRESVKEAIASCQSANIKIKMITGDHPLTAHAVADEAGITHDHEHLFTGDQLSLMSQDERWKAYREGAIFSRVLPEQKHEMVNALKSAGFVVAMTGDGINDAPALKLADIGISMGVNATDVARSSAQMILLKNDFNGIVRAVFEGRRIFSNLKRSFSYLVSFHVPVILLALLPPLLGWGDLLLPIHIVLLELIVHPISAFAFENLEANEISNEKGLLSKKSFLEALLSGFLLSFFAIILFKYFSLHIDLSAARTIALSTVLLGNIFFVYVESQPKQTIRTGMTYIILLGLTSLIALNPGVSKLFHLGTIGRMQVLLALGSAGFAVLPTYLMRRKVFRSV